ncbi:MAG: PTS fructose transporter subunit IIA [Planctomycetaceae bacterium]|nr:MAG: PTS fructose transporter subunit IIA [Planctomycetaceae bacterium]
MTLDELAKFLGRDRREIERLVQRGRIPGRRVGQEWRFSTIEIMHWLEQEMREYTNGELEKVEAGQRSGEIPSGSAVAQLLSLETVEVPLQSRTKRAVLESLVEVAGRSLKVLQPSTVLQALLEREAVLPTAIEHGVAFPHPRNPLPAALDESVLAFGRTACGIPFGAPRGELTDLFFLILCRDPRTHLQTLARLSRLVREPGVLDALREAQDSATAYRAILEADQRLS